MTTPPRRQRSRHGEPNPVTAARALRRRQTPAEATLWDRLRGHQLGYAFRRQHIIAGFVVDFCCPARCLVVELDGAVHDDGDQQRQDTWRTGELTRHGYTVIRFRNDDVLATPDLVIARILAALDGS